MKSNLSFSTYHFQPTTLFQYLFIKTVLRGISKLNHAYIDKNASSEHFTMQPHGWTLR